MRNKFYEDGSYKCMYHNCYQLKWGIIIYLIRKYCFYKPQILDLGCGNMPVCRWLRAEEIASNTMVEQDDHIAAELRAAYPSGTIICADYEKLDTTILEHKFNCIVWAGIESDPAKYYDIMSKYIGILDINGIFILDYMAVEPELIGERIGKQSLIKKLIHLNGCKIIMPYIPPIMLSRWPKVNERRIEIFRLR